jgi:hypothetical protein
MIESLLVGLILAAIVALVGCGIVTVIPARAAVKTVVWVFIGVICLLILLQAVTGGGFDI